ncbi:MAG: hypothetical protein HY913_12940 [Desulfomonile tiedjei]|nr:hypothetical protein [Desulfomonile tiedjei]
MENTVKRGRKGLEKASAVIRNVENAAAEQKTQMEHRKAEFLRTCKRLIDPQRCDDFVQSITDKRSTRTPSSATQKGPKLVPEDRFKTFNRAFPDFGKEEFHLANDDLYPDFIKNVSAGGTWTEFLAVYKEFVEWWIDQGSPRESGIKLWEDFLDDLPESIVRLSMLYHDHYVTDEQDEMMAFYDFPIDYYEHGLQNRPFVENEWKQYFEKWDYRYSTIESIKRAGGSVASGEVKVRIKYFFTWWDASGKPFAGNRIAFITWKKIGRNWKIKGLSEKRAEAAEDE